ncbi:zinc finger 239-like [Octopus vulgaris]|uniref:Zinc finger 239-like n=1 Tax=Octopus vulgaris TaxID=6645 RepID=A0AA36C2M2_OCTVU|nr:zinc finger 239-like [Octopus vulgaris]
MECESCDDNVDWNLKGLVFSDERPIGICDASYQCDICKKSFSQKDILASHRCIHTGEKPYHCDICGKSFSQKINLTTHKRIHSGEKPHRFTQHVRIHTGQKPYHCDICGESFSRNDSLTAHRHLHTGEKPYRHKRIHTGEKPYDCDACGSSFSDGGTLSRHKRIHTGESPISVISVVLLLFSSKSTNFGQVPESRGSEDLNLLANCEEPQYKTGQALLRRSQKLPYYLQKVLQHPSQKKEFVSGMSPADAMVSLVCN